MTPKKLHHWLPPPWQRHSRHCHHTKSSGSSRTLKANIKKKCFFPLESSVAKQKKLETPVTPSYLFFHVWFLFLVSAEIVATNVIRRELFLLAVGTIHSRSSFLETHPQLLYLSLVLLSKHFIFPLHRLVHFGQPSLHRTSICFLIQLLLELFFVLLLMQTTI